jgi:hypothetical protein
MNEMKCECVLCGLGSAAMKVAVVFTRCLFHSAGKLDEHCEQRFHYTFVTKLGSLS